MFKDNFGGTRPPKQTSKPQNTAVGSGARPPGGMLGIPTSAPADPQTLGKAPKGWLK